VLDPVDAVVLGMHSVTRPALACHPRGIEAPCNTLGRLYQHSISIQPLSGRYLALGMSPETARVLYHGLASHGTPMAATCRVVRFC
jgi:hypothetical protein